MLARAEGLVRQPPASRTRSGAGELRSLSSAIRVALVRKEHRAVMM